MSCRVTIAVQLLFNATGSPLSLGACLRASSNRYFMLTRRSPRAFTDDLGKDLRVLGVVALPGKLVVIEQGKRLTHCAPLFGSPAAACCPARRCSTRSSTSRSSSAAAAWAKILPSGAPSAVMSAQRSAFAVSSSM